MTPTARRTYGRATASKRLHLLKDKAHGTSARR